LASGYYQIVPNAAKNLRVDIGKSSKSVGAAAACIKVSNALSQRFLVKKVSSSAPPTANGTGVAGTTTAKTPTISIYYSVQNVNSQHFLADDNGSPEQSDEPSAGLSDKHLWQVVLQSDGYVLVNKASGRYLGLDKSNKLMLGTSQGARSIFSFTKTVPFDVGYYRLYTSTGLYIDLSSGSTKDGAALRLEGKSSATTQKFRVTKSGYYFVMRNFRSFKAVEVKGGAKAAAGSVVQQSTYKATKNQRFTMLPAGGGWWYLKTAAGLYLSAKTPSKDGSRIYTTTDPGKALKLKLSKAGQVTGNTTVDYRVDSILTAVGRAGTPKQILQRSYRYLINRYPYRTASLYPTGQWKVNRALDMVKRKSGNCYRYAALYCVIAEALGYDANVVSGWVPTVSGYKSPHGWVEIRSGTKTYLVDVSMGRSYSAYRWFWITYSDAPIEYHVINRAD